MGHRAGHSDADRPALLGRDAVKQFRTILAFAEVLGYEFSLDWDGQLLITEPAKGWARPLPERPSDCDPAARRQLRHGKQLPRLQGRASQVGDVRIPRRRPGVFRRVRVVRKKGTIGAGRKDSRRRNAMIPTGHWRAILATAALLLAVAFTAAQGSECENCPPGGT